MTELKATGNLWRCIQCSTAYDDLDQMSHYADDKCHLCAVENIPMSLKLANHYLPRVWPGLLLIVPALLVLPAYDKSIWFHAWMTLSWLYWIICLYKMHRTLQKAHPSYSIGPLKASLVSACVGTHPFNYLFELLAVLLVLYPGTALPLLIVPAVPAAFLFGIWWYVKIFAQARNFIASRSQEKKAPTNPGPMIAICLIGPGIVQLLVHMMGDSMGWALWLGEALVPVGLAMAFFLMLLFTRRVAKAVSNDQPSIELQTPMNALLGQRTNSLL